MKLTCELSSSFGIMSGSEVGDILFLQLGVTVYELEPKKKNGYLAPAGGKSII